MISCRVLQVDVLYCIAFDINLDSLGQLYKREVLSINKNQHYQNKGCCGARVGSVDKAK